LLDVIGIEAPEQINGVVQAPFNGVSFAHTLESATEPSKHITQYYEMLGSRALYHDGWKAVVFHPPGMMNYESGNINPSFDDDVWELYNIANDFSECNDVALQFPDKLKELQQLWWTEAEANQVLPLNNQPARYGDRRFLRDRYVYLPGISPLPESTAPNLKNRSFQITAALHIPAEGNCDGILVCHGGHAGGYACTSKVAVCTTHTTSLVHSPPLFQQALNCLLVTSMYVQHLPQLAVSKVTWSCGTAMFPLGAALFLSRCLLPTVLTPSLWVTSA
jgi:arylsulfatase